MTLPRNARLSRTAREWLEVMGVNFVLYTGEGDVAAIVSYLMAGHRESTGEEGKGSHPVVSALRLIKSYQYHKSFLRLIYIKKISKT